MIMSETAFVIYQYVAYVWFCIGAAMVAFVSVRDLIRLVKESKAKKK